MKFTMRLLAVLSCAVLTGMCLASCEATSSSDSNPDSKPQSTSSTENFEPVDITRGLNLSALEGKHQQYSYLDKKETYTNVASKGFDHIRLPVDFRNYANSKGVVKKSFYRRLDKIIDMANDEGLAVMLDFHGWYDFNVSHGDAKLFLNIWSDVAEHYKNHSNMLMFELINEPHETEGGDLNMDVLTALQTTAIENIREISPHRTIIVATAEWNGPWTLRDFDLTQFDNIIVAIHTYEPMDFTHQGFSWMGTQDVKLELTDEMLEKLDKQLKLITDFRNRTGMKVVINEFGVNTSGHISDEDVHRYLSHITAFAEENDIAWTYWEYNAGFGVYKTKGWGPAKGEWRENVLDALLNPNDK